MGKPLDVNLIKKPHQQVSWTEQQMIELARCLDPVSGPEYFLSHYYYIQHPIKGRILYQPFDYQKMHDDLQNFTPPPTNINSDSDPSKFEILGIRIGMTPKQAESALKSTYPKIRRYDNEQIFNLGPGARTPPLILGSEYVAGNATSVVRQYWQKSMTTHYEGAKELNGDSETVAVSYIYPSLGNVVAIKRVHEYKSYETRPNYEKLKADLITKFGRPKYIFEHKGADDNTTGWTLYPDLSKTTMYWSAQSQLIPGSNGFVSCIHLMESSATYATSSTLSMFGPANECGTFIMVEIAPDPKMITVARVTEYLNDSSKNSNATKSLVDYFVDLQKSGTANIKKTR